MMNTKPRSLENLEEKMKAVDAHSLRHHILEHARNFKSSWVELGRALYTVWKDKMYKEWGFGDFDIYVSKEIGIRKNTALKLLRSYYFLEKEEPGYVKKEYIENAQVASIPQYEAVNTLRSAKGKGAIDAREYERLKKDVFEKGRDAQEIKRDVTSLIRQREELDPEEAREQKRSAVLRRLVGVLKSLKQEGEVGKLLPVGIIKETEHLIEELEAELG
jgi:hypothetical protein